MSGTTTATRRVAYVAYTFPVLTQTFTTREVGALRAAGMELTVFAARPGADARLDPEAEHEARLTQYLPAPYSATALVQALLWLTRRPLRFLATLLACLGGAYRDDGLRCRLRAPLHFVIGAALASRLRHVGGFARIHAQMVDAGSTVAFVASRLLDLPFSFTNHTAYNPFLLALKARHAELVVSISEYDRADVVRRVGRPAGRHEVARVGIRVDDWAGLERTPEPGRVVSVAALRDKKGHEDLVRAAAALHDAGTEIRVVIVGDGAERATLERVIRETGAPVELAGAAPPSRVREELARATAFCLPCRTAANGDIDGIPVALMEAMAAGVPVIATRLSGVPELIEDGASGLLVPERDPAALAEALACVLSDVDLAAHLSAGGRRRVAAAHDLGQTAARLCGLLLGTP